MVAWGWRWKQGLTANRQEGTFLGGDRSILKLDSGDGYTTINLLQLEEIHIIKMGKFHGM